MRAIRAILVELDYISSHFPMFALNTIPKILIGILIVQVILGLIRFVFRKAETGKLAELKKGIATFSLILWWIVAILIGVYLYYYWITEVRNE